QATAEAEKRRQEADGKAVELKTLLERARASLKDFQGLRGAKVCRHCGQLLTPGHYEEEKRKREAEVESAKTAFSQAEAVQKKAREEEARCRQEQAVVEGELQSARDEYAICKGRLDQSHKDVERLTRECGQTVTDLPAMWRERAAGAGADGEPSFPSEADLKRMREQVEGLEPTRQKLKESETQLTRWQALRVQAEQTRQTLQALEVSLPGDVGALRRKHIQMTTEESTLANSLKATREQERQATDEL